mgnify:CR=1 FL=1
MDRKTTAFVIWLLVCCVLSSCGRDSLPERDFERVAHPGPTAAPLLVIGVDGLEWNVILAMLRDGSLPHLARFMRQGVYGRLNTLRTPQSPVVWASVATGKIPDKHGILGFTRRNNEGNRQLYNNGDRKTKAVWNILSDYGKRVAVIGWWMTYLVEQINGIMVAQTNTLGGALEGEPERRLAGTGLAASRAKRNDGPAQTLARGVARPRQRDLWSLPVRADENERKAMGRVPMVVSGRRNLSEHRPKPARKRKAIRLDDGLFWRTGRGGPALQAFHVAGDLRSPAVAEGDRKPWRRHHRLLRLY